MTDQQTILITSGLLTLIAFKDIFGVGDFNLYYWFKYGKIYSNWHNNRETFKQYLEQQKWYQEMDSVKKDISKI